jgi:hypothetical protein
MDHVLCDGRITGDVILCHTNNKRYKKINNKNSRTDGFNNLKPLSQIIKKYDQKTFKHNRH